MRTESFLNKSPFRLEIKKQGEERERIPQSRNIDNYYRFQRQPSKRKGKI